MLPHKATRPGRHAHRSWSDFGARRRSCPPRSPPWKTRSTWAVYAKSTGCRTLASRRSVSRKLGERGACRSSGLQLSPRSSPSPSSNSLRCVTDWKMPRGSSRCGTMRSRTRTSACQGCAWRTTDENESWCNWATVSLNSGQSRATWRPCSPSGRRRASGIERRRDRRTAVGRMYEAVQRGGKRPRRRSLLGLGDCMLFRPRTPGSGRTCNRWRCPSQRVTQSKNSSKRSQINSATPACRRPPCSRPLPRLSSCGVSGKTSRFLAGSCIVSCAMPSPPWKLRGGGVGSWRCSCRKQKQRSAELDQAKTI
mmetsp:Transcript_50879/g.164677  ORF Transcript_50879/g.164677 Transcript_50879/m.164677 type:complete len:309 (-) Transcript_50879:1300-2226(-)